MSGIFSAYSLAAFYNCCLRGSIVHAARRGVEEPGIAAGSCRQQRCMYNTNMVFRKGLQQRLDMRGSNETKSAREHMGSLSDATAACNCLFQPAHVRYFALMYRYDKQEYLNKILDNVFRCRRRMARHACKQCVGKAVSREAPAALQRP